MQSIKKVHMDFTLEIVDKVFYAWHHSLDASTTYEWKFTSNRIGGDVKRAQA